LPDYWLEHPKPMSTDVGMNLIAWNVRYDSPPAFSHSYEINANYMETPASPEGPLALPGIYTVKLTVEGKSYTQTVTVKNDPRSPATAAELAAQGALQRKVYDGIRAAWDGNHQVAVLRKAVTDTNKPSLPADVTAALTAFDTKIGAIGGRAGGRGAGPGGGGGAQPAGAAPPAPNFAAIHGALLRQLATLDSGDMAPNESMTKVFESSCKDLKTAAVNWTAAIATDLPALNAVLTKAGAAPISAASPALTLPACAASPAATTGARGRGGR
jgi:hypothetical protein